MRLPAIVFSTAAGLWVTLGVALAEQSVSETPALDRYRETLERPLFSPARRATVHADQVVADPVDMPILQGVVLARDKRIALLAYGNPSKAQRISEGQDVGPWKVDKIVKDHVILRAPDGKAATVRLKTKGLHQAANSALSR